MTRLRTPIEAISLRAGPLRVVYENGALHTLCAYGVEIWRGIMFLYRDGTWRTPVTIAHDLDLVADDESFRLAFDAHCANAPGLSWRTIVDGKRDGSIRFAVEARLDKALATNRTGLCLLHPLTAAGARIDIEHADGRVSRSTFPVLISPWQPFTNIRAARHEYMPGCWASARLEGAVFEMEDQRNFSDASFKIYSGSNLGARPYRLAEGESIRQSVTLTLERCTGASAAQTNACNASVDVASAGSGRLPRLALAATSHDSELEQQPALWHASLNCTKTTRDDEWRAIERAERAADVAIELLLADDADPAPECEEIAQRLTSIGITPESVAIFPTTQAFVAAARAAFPRSLVGGGTPWFFTHLNRASLPPDLDFITFRTCPIVHVADDRSVMQSLATLPAIVATLRAGHPGVPFRVGPSAISMTVNPFGPWAEASSTSPIAMARNDPRDRSTFGAAWALAYLARLAAAGADAVSLASPFAFRALAPLASLAGAPLCDVRTSDDRIVALAVEATRGIELWIANTSGKRLNVAVNVRDRSPSEYSIDAFDFVRAGIIS